MARKVRTVEQKLARIASRDHGTVDRQELLSAGVTDHEIRRRVQKGALIPEFRAVWRVGHRAPSREAWYMAAVKAGPDDALLRGPPAAHGWGLVKGKAPPPEIVSRGECRVPGLQGVRCRNLVAADGTRWRGIPITTVPRTLVDLAAILPIDALARACHEAGVLHGTTPGQVKKVLLRRPKSAGVAKLRLIMAGDEPVLLSKLEAGFIKLLRAQRLPLPVTNKPAGGRRVDCRWPEHRLTVELDSYWFHRSRYAWQQGHRREREAYARGDQFRRYTWADVFEDPTDMLRELRALLNRS